MIQLLIIFSLRSSKKVIMPKKNLRPSRALLSLFHSLIPLNLIQDWIRQSDETALMTSDF